LQDFIYKIRAPKSAFHYYFAMFHSTVLTLIFIIQTFISNFRLHSFFIQNASLNQKLLAHDNLSFLKDLLLF